METTAKRAEKMAASTIKIRVIPKASKNEVVGWRGDALCVKVTAPPLDGAANEAVIRFLAEVMGVKKGDVRIVAGERSRDKVVAIEGVSAEYINSKLCRHQ